MRTIDKIIEFDELDKGENTLAKLEEIFDIKINEDKTELVIIGEPEVGGLRTLFIGDKRFITLLDGTTSRACRMTKR